MFLASCAFRLSGLWHTLQPRQQFQTREHLHGWPCHSDMHDPGYNPEVHNGLPVTRNQYSNFKKESKRQLGCFFYLVYLLICKTVV